MGLSLSTLSERPAAQIALLVGLVLLVYFNSLGNGFVWDDNQIIIKNPLMSEVRNIPDLLSSEDTFAGERSGYYRPLTYLTFFADRYIWGLDPFGFHLMNLLLHIGVAMSFYFLISMISGENSLAFMSALIFSLHPVNAETVNFLSGGRNTLLAAFFMVAAFIFYVRTRYTLSALSFGLSIFSKEFGILMPVLIYFYDTHVMNSRKPLRQYLPFAVIVMLYLTVRYLVLGGSGINFDIRHLPNRAMMTPEIIIGYLKVLIMPLSLKLPYVIRPPRYFDLRVASYTSGFLLFLAALFAVRNKGLLFFSLLWVGLFFIPVANIVPIGYIPMAERYAYFSTMGFSLLLSLMLTKASRHIRMAVLLIYCAVFAAVVIQRNPVWKENTSLYRQMIADSPDSSLGYFNLGMMYSEKGDVQQAVFYLEKAVHAFPVRANTFITLASVYLDNQDREKAMQLLTEAVSLEPDNFKGLIMLSRLYAHFGDTDKARLYYNKAKAIFPEIETVLRERADFTTANAERLQAENKLAEAEVLYKRALLYDPESSRALLGIGSIIAQRGMVDEAVQLFRKAAALDPLNPIPHYNLSMSYKLKGLSAKASEEMTQFTELKRKSDLRPQQ